jgi:methylthioribose-1-phosphate isomerase
MTRKIATAIRYEDGVIQLLNQKTLPHQEEWITCNTIEAICDAIYQLKVRGAPLIGVAAALFLAVLMQQDMPVEKIKEAAVILRKTRPTAVNLMHCIDRVMASLLTHGKEHAILTAEGIFDEDIALCEQMAEAGASLIADGDQVMTYCNTGSLATAGIGTALGVIRKAHQQGKNIHVFVNETRPLLQGGRLTAWELENANIPYTLISDNMAAHLMSLGKIDRIFVGADRIATNGDFANKIGTYGLAVTAHYHQVPFYVVAPYTTVDQTCHSGCEIIIEERHSDEIRGVSGHFGNIVWAPTQSPVFNPAFDITPAKLVAGYILDKGFYLFNQIKNGILKEL